MTPDELTDEAIERSLIELGWMKGKKTMPSIRRIYRIAAVLYRRNQKLKETLKQTVGAEGTKWMDKVKG